MGKKIKINDQVIVVTGQDKGKLGAVVGFKDGGRRIVVSGVNVRKKSIKAKNTQGQMQEGGFKNIELPIDISNVALYNTETSKGDKVSFIFENDKKIRAYRSTKTPVVEKKRTKNKGSG